MSYRTSQIAALLLVSALLAGAVPCRAMVVVRRDFPELVARSEQIVVGTVGAIREEQDASGAPFTLVTFSELSVLKGDAGTTLTLRFYGGTVGGVTMHIPDIPSFALGERDVLFIAGNGSSVCPLVGVWQGRYYVRFSRTLGTDVIDDNNHQPLFGVAQRELLRAPASSNASAGGTTPMTLDAFRQLITDELAQPPSGQ